MAENGARTRRHERFTMPLGPETIGALGISASHCLPCCSHAARGGGFFCGGWLKGMNRRFMAAGKGEDVGEEKKAGTRRK